MKAPRNPRRAYDQDGNEDLPATIASTHALGMSSVMAFCEVQGCGHDAVIPLEGRPDATAVPDMALRLRYSKCGSRKIRMMLNVCELYTKVHGAGSPQP